ARDIALVASVAAEPSTKPRSERIDEPKAGVVAGEQVLRPWVAEPHDDFEWSTWHSNEPTKKKTAGAQRPAVRNLARPRLLLGRTPSRSVACARCLLGSRLCLLGRPR